MLCQSINRWLFKSWLMFFFLAAGGLFYSVNACYLAYYNEGVLERKLCSSRM